jgi:hypothetical protein
MVVLVVVMGEQRYAYRVMVGKSEGRRPLGRLDVGGRIILKSIILEK